MTEQKNNIVYKITNKKTGRIYVGIHSTNGNFKKERYYGSGTDIKRDVERYGRGQFKREVLHNFSTIKNGRL